MERVRFNQTRSCGFPHFFDYFLFGCPLFIWDIFPQFPQFYLENQKVFLQNQKESLITAIQKIKVTKI